MKKNNHGFGKFILFLTAVATVFAFLYHFKNQLAEKLKADGDLDSDLDIFPDTDRTYVPLNHEETEEETVFDEEVEDFEFDEDSKDSDTEN